MLAASRSFRGLLLVVGERRRAALGERLAARCQSFTQASPPNSPGLRSKQAKKIRARLMCKAILLTEIKAAPNDIQRAFKCCLSAATLLLKWKEM